MHEDNPCFFQDIQLNHLLKTEVHCRFLKVDRKIAAPNASAREHSVSLNDNFRIGLKLQMSAMDLEKF
jgi:hypothetical protein